MFTVIAFDIVDDRVRYRVVKRLRACSVRVQKSVFEAPKLSPKQFARLRADLERLIDAEEDQVRYYFLCATCRGRLELSGPGRVAVHRDYEIV